MVTCKDCLYRHQISDEETWCSTKTLKDPYRLDENVPCDKHVGVTEQQYNEYQKMNSTERRKFTRKLKFNPVDKWQKLAVKEERLNQELQKTHVKLEDVRRERIKLEKNYPTVVTEAIAKTL